MKIIDQHSSVGLFYFFFYSLTFARLYDSIGKLYINIIFNPPEGFLISL